MKKIRRAYTAPYTKNIVISGNKPLMTSGNANTAPIDYDATPGDQSQAESRRRNYSVWDDEEDNVNPPGRSLPW